MHEMALRESYRLIKERRGPDLMCAQLVSKLLHDDAAARYGAVVASVPHLQLKAALVDEPAHDKVCDMLSALSPEESLFYQAERNVIDLEGKSEVLFKEIEDHYNFIGGDYKEYV